VVNERIGSIVHFSALLSALGEKNIALALQLNVVGLHNVLEVSRIYRLKLFIPSSIGQFFHSVTPKTAILNRVLSLF